MPIRRYLEKGVVFAPEALSSMGNALEETAELLGISSDEAKRRDVARFIIRLAREEDNLDAAALRDRTVAALGGVAYSAMSGVSETSNPRAPTELAQNTGFVTYGEASPLTG